MRLLSLVLAFLLPSLAAQAQQKPVALELVLAIDTSTSVDHMEFELQRRGLSNAFTHPDIISAISALGNLGIAVSLIEWAGSGQQKTIVGWSHVFDTASAFEFSEKLRVAPRAISGMTDIGGAIRFSAEAIRSNQYEGIRKVIDVSGDGSGNINSSKGERDRAVAGGITINGLVIFNADYDLGELAQIDVREHYRDHVIGGDGAFLMTAADFVHFQEAIKNKLLREIIGPATARLPVIAR